MKNIVKLISYTGLLLTLLPAFFVFYGVISFDTYKWLMAAGTIVWFGSTPFWMNKNKEK